METIRYLLGFVAKLALVLLIGAFALWLVNLLYPNLSLGKIFDGKIFSTDWLPAPRNLGQLNKNNQKDMYGTLYVHTNPQPNGGYIAYTGTSNSSGAVFNGNTSSYAARSAYLRNLSFFDGGLISYGSTYIGEAKGTMFQNGTFPVIIVDNEGRVLASTPAINTGSWATPGWVRFQFTIPTKLPSAPCALIFLSAQEQHVGIRMNMRCY